MTLNKPGNRNVDKLCSLILGEADWNLGGRIHVNRRMLQNAFSHSLIPSEHYGGIKNKKATDDVLDKRLGVDNIRLECRAASITSTDAANCYDRMLHSYISLSAQKLGAPLAVLLALLRPLQESRHYIRTAYGDSHEYYGGKRPVPFQAFWIIISSPLINFMRSQNVCSTFTTAIILIVFALIMVLYVDDNDIFVTSDKVDEIRDIFQRTQECISMWKETLKVAGGVVRPIECCWILVDFAWNGKNYKYKSMRDSPGFIYI